MEDGDLSIVDVVEIDGVVVGVGVFGAVDVVVLVLVDVGVAVGVVRVFSLGLFVCFLV